MFKENFFIYQYFKKSPKTFSKSAKIDKDGNITDVTAENDANVLPNLEKEKKKIEDKRLLKLLHPEKPNDIMIYPWKYADAEKAKNLKAENPNKDLQDKEIEESAYQVSWMEEWKETPLDDQWQNKKFRDAIVKNILENRVPWKYADAEKAKNLKAENPNKDLKDNEIEKAAYNVSWMEEWKETPLDDQWKKKKFRDAIVKNILENRT